VRARQRYIYIDRYTSRTTQNREQTHKTDMQKRSAGGLRDKCREQNGTAGVVWKKEAGWKPATHHTQCTKRRATVHESIR
jgi:hypothetical protein